MATINQDELIEVCKESKCPLRRMYALYVLERMGDGFRSVNNFHAADAVFENCEHCTGYGFYKDKIKKRGRECIKYPFLIDARQFVREQVKQASFAAVREAAGD